jgi:putative PIN family toxin of toxin-antitoxin system
MVKVVFDTVVFVRSLLNPYNFCGRALFQHVERYRLVVSRPVVEEILEVLHREELRSKFRTLARLDLARVIDILGQAEVVEIPVVGGVSRDPKDNKFLATAAAAGAAYLVSQDKDLLDLQEYQGMPILTCEAFLEILGQQ